MDLYVVRHAIAEPRDPERWPDDALRPLSQDGVELFRAAARGLRELGVEVDAVLSSPYARAWRTAELLAEEAGWPAPEESTALEATRTAADALAAVRTRREPALAVVGHQPQLSELGSLLLAGAESSLDLELKKGGVICLRFAGAPANRAARLRWSASPRILRRLGR